MDTIATAKADAQLVLAHLDGPPRIGPKDRAQWPATTPSVVITCGCGRAHHARRPANHRTHR